LGREWGGLIKRIWLWWALYGIWHGYIIGNKKGGLAGVYGLV
jgi:hypothetical protein